jgi:outer membrane protein TolC
MLKLPALSAILITASVILSGCLVAHPPCQFDEEVDYYRTLASSSTPPPDAPDYRPGQAPLSTGPPLLVDESTPPPAWDLTLATVIQLGLENSKVLRDLGGSVLRRPTLAQTIHDPAIQATDPRFGMEGALAAFDTQLATRLIAQKNDRAFNNLFLGGGAFLFQQDLNNFESELSKKTATGASFALRHRIDYDANNAPANVFFSVWNTNYEAEFRQPLLQGAGVEFNRIAGPRAVPGLVNGVEIARVTNDVSTAEFEIGVRDLVSNLENAYWDLYYAYRELDAKIAARDASLNTWRIIHANVQEGRGYSKLQEVQALEQYYHFQEEVLDALGGRNVERTHTFNGSSGGTFRGVGGVHAAERRLRLWMGLPINDGKLIRPIDEPPSAKLTFDWCQIVQETLSRRPDLRRQQSQVERYNLELVATRNFLLPKLDVLGRYRARGFGHGWMGPSNPAEPYDNALANLLSGQFQEWELGFEYSMPLGFRREYAAVRNAQFRVARERAILEEQERQAVHDLSAAYADSQRAYALMHASYNRLNAAQDQYRRAYVAFFDLGGKVSLELVLDARIRLADAETSYHRARIDYAVALKNIHFEKGSLLEHDGAVLSGDAFCQGAAKMIVHSEMAARTPELNYVLAKKPPELATDGGVKSSSPQSAPQSPATTRPVDEARVNQAATTEPLENRPVVNTLGFERPNTMQESVQPTTYYAPAAPQIGGSERRLDFDTTQSVLAPLVGAPQNAAEPAGSPGP